MHEHWYSNQTRRILSDYKLTRAPAHNPAQHYMKENTYQGYKNRSTWLTVLWLDNKRMITPVLLEIKELWREQDFDALKINFAEVWEHLAPSTKY